MDVRSSESSSSPVSTLLRRPGQSKPAVRRTPSSAHASVSAITKLNDRLYFAPTSAVRSPRLSELEVAHLITVRSDAGGAQGEEKFGDIQSHTCVINDGARGHQEEAGELRRVCRIIADSRGVVLVHGKDLNAVALVCAAYLMQSGRQSSREAEESVRTKRPDFEFKFDNFRLVLAELNESIDPNAKSGQRLVEPSEALSGRERIAKLVKTVAKNWFILVMVGVGIGVLARLIFMHKDTLMKKYC